MDKESLPRKVWGSDCRRTIDSPLTLGVRFWPTRLAVSKRAGSRQSHTSDRKFQRSKKFQLVRRPARICGTPIAEKEAHRQNEPGEGTAGNPQTLSLP